MAVRQAPPQVWVWCGAAERPVTSANPQTKLLASEDSAWRRITESGDLPRIRGPHWGSLGKEHHLGSWAPRVRVRGRICFQFGQAAETQNPRKPQRSPGLHGAGSPSVSSV